MRVFSLFLLVLLFCFPVSVRAQDAPIDFIFPLECTLGTDCVTVNYVDQQPGEGHADYECGRKTYDGHKGVDFAVPNRRDMVRGVNVIAARTGRVLRIRDGEDDAIKTEKQFQAVKASGKECGNGVLIEHENGWKSYYCHLKKGSVLVQPGDAVVEGQAIAQVGQSGFSEFPHLHFSVLDKNGRYIDPFTGLRQQTACNMEQASLWRTPMKYVPFTLFDAGFAAVIPDFTALQQGEYKKPDFIVKDSDALIYWVAFYHAVQGDQVTMTITTPTGLLFHKRSFTLEENKKRPSYFYAGKKTDNAPLMSGDYIGRTEFVRKDASGIIVHRHVYEHMIHVK